MTFASVTNDALPLTLIFPEDLEDWMKGCTDAQKTWASNSNFKGNTGQVLLLPEPDGSVSAAVGGLGDKKSRARNRFLIAKLRASLPAGNWYLAESPSNFDEEEVALGWLLAGYRFDRYAKSPSPKAMLVAPDRLDSERIEHIAAAEALTRDLINTPAEHMGPDELESAALSIANEFGATCDVIRSEDLLDRNFPLIHTVGRASHRAPRLIDIRWGTGGPSLTLVGKGVCFDTGGLNLKPGSSMALMKKDMGGAASVLGLARMIMSGGMPCRLRVLIPAVENAVSGAAFRPGDILHSRKGLTVEINNTDAEGRLVLADALALADDEKPDLVISMATLTGAARVALGPDLAPFYATSESDAELLVSAADRVADPVWRLPFWPNYERMIEPGIADLDNAPKGGFAGSITAALFLRRFVTQTDRYLHFDIFGWSPTNEPGRPKGGAGQGIRALFEALPKMLGL